MLIDWKVSFFDNQERDHHDSKPLVPIVEAPTNEL